MAGASFFCLETAWRWSKHVDVDEWELYDLQQDADELTSLYSDPKYAGIVKKLKLEIRRLQAAYKIPQADTKPPKPGTKKRRPKKKQ